MEIVKCKIIQYGHNSQDTGLSEYKAMISDSLVEKNTFKNWPFIENSYIRFGGKVIVLKGALKEQSPLKKHVHEDLN